MNNGKVSSFLRDCLLKCNRAPYPGDDVHNKTFEKDRGHVSMVNTIEKAIKKAGGEVSDEENDETSRIDEPFRDIIIRTWYKMFHVGNYYAGLFVPECSDEEFKRDLLQIWDILIRNTIMGSVFLGYGEDLAALDKEIMIQKGDVDNLPNAQLHCPFRLYTRTGYGKFYSILAGHEIDDTDGKIGLEDKLVKFWIRDANY